jgi:hypothetical protein
VFLRAGQMADLDARRTEVLGKAARIIQRLMRTYIARKQFVLVKRSATRLQSFVRGIGFLCVCAHSLKCPLADGPCGQSDRDVISSNAVAVVFYRFHVLILSCCVTQGPWSVICTSA